MTTEKPVSTINDLSGMSEQARQIWQQYLEETHRPILEHAEQSGPFCTSLAMFAVIRQDWGLERAGEQNLWRLFMLAYEHSGVYMLPFWVTTYSQKRQPMPLEAWSILQGQLIQHQTGDLAQDYQLFYLNIDVNRPDSTHAAAVALTGDPLKPVFISDSSKARIYSVSWPEFLRSEYSKPLDCFLATNALEMGVPVSAAEYFQELTGREWQKTQKSDSI